MNLIRKSSWVIPGKWKTGLLGTEDGWGRESWIPKPRKGPYKRLALGIIRLTEQNGACAHQRLGWRFRDESQPRRVEGERGPADQHWIQMSGASQASIPHRLTNSQALCGHQVSIIPAGNLGSFDQRKVHRRALLILSLTVLLEFWFSYLNGSYFKSLKEFQNTYVQLIYWIPRIRFLESRCLEIMRPHWNISFKNHTEHHWIGE